MALLVITEGKTTTDHISPAGPWLRFRGHLDRISDNMFLGALARGSRKRGTTRDPLTGESSKPIAAVARGLKAAQRRWVVVGDENYGEGSSREHAAMSPRHLGAAAIVARGFARIHETNLKKQGVLPLTFADPSDYQRVREDDELSLPGIFDIEEGKAVSALLHHAGGGDEAIELEHSLNQEQINWWRAGSALNLLTTANAQRSEA
jgi:aconitate hydratase